MKLKFEVKQAVQQHVKKGEIVENDVVVKSQCRLFLSKAERNLATANLLLTITEQKRLKDIHGLPNDFSAAEWGIIISYYSMFHAAKGALAKLGIKITEDNPHEATLNSMYFYYLFSGKLEEKLFDKLQNAKEEAIKLIESLGRARTLRNEVNYELKELPRVQTAKGIFDDAKVFVSKMKEIVFL
ncbi:hypothetical protein HZA97_09995 [Candidatus Woesearchaeota archaeon]|nr:hypothetical protein [Candidatus Woesearchaeota archaeon]